MGVENNKIFFVFKEARDEKELNVIASPGSGLVQVGETQFRTSLTVL